MKSIGVITFHRANSYGAQLQAYATIEFLIQNGYKAEIINYVNPYEQRFQNFFHTDNGTFKGYLINFIKDYVLFKRLYGKRAFSHPEKLMPVSHRSYKSVEDLDAVDYDLLVAGSDQIWNPQITNGVDKVFLLQFGKAKKRVSIASSFGSYTLSDTELDEYRSAFQFIDAISTREEFGKRQIEKLTEKPIKVLMDPTFLIDSTHWKTQIANKSQFADVKEKYILTFFVAPQANYKERVKKYAEALDLPVWSIQSTLIKRVNCDRSILGANIYDFIALLQNAALVITDSFHGVALSLNLQKDFVAFSNVGNPVRVASLLNNLGLGNRLDMEPDQLSRIEYESINEKLEELRVDSKTWVLDALGE